VRVKGYQWQAGKLGDGFVPITYLIGYPTKTCSCEMINSLDDGGDR
jgi:hypothetical protein